MLLLYFIMFDDLPQLKKNTFTACDLTDMSVDEIKEYIAQLEAEIIRAQKDIEQKQNSKSAAESVFKS